jgi:hypothetical protein
MELKLYEFFTNIIEFVMKIVDLRCCKLYLHNILKEYFYIHQQTFIVNFFNKKLAAI